MARAEGAAAAAAVAVDRAVEAVGEAVEAAAEVEVAEKAKQPCCGTYQVPAKNSTAYLAADSTVNLAIAPRAYLS